MTPIYGYVIGRKRDDGGMEWLYMIWEDGAMEPTYYWNQNTGHAFGTQQRTYVRRLAQQYGGTVYPLHLGEPLEGK